MSMYQPYLRLEGQMIRIGPPMKTRAAAIKAISVRGGLKYGIQFQDGMLPPWASILEVESYEDEAPRRKPAPS